MISRQLSCDDLGQIADEGYELPARKVKKLICVQKSMAGSDLVPCD